MSEIHFSDGSNAYPDYGRSFHITFNVRDYKKLKGVLPQGKEQKGSSGRESLLPGLFGILFSEKVRYPTNWQTDGVTLYPEAFDYLRDFDRLMGVKETGDLFGLAKITHGIAATAIMAYGAKREHQKMPLIKTKYDGEITGLGGRVSKEKGTITIKEPAATFGMEVQIMDSLQSDDVPLFVNSRRAYVISDEELSQLPAVAVKQDSILRGMIGASYEQQRLLDLYGTPNFDRLHDAWDSAMKTTHPIEAAEAIVSGLST